METPKYEQIVIIHEPEINKANIGIIPITTHHNHPDKQGIQPLGNPNRFHRDTWRVQDMIFSIFKSSNSIIHMKTWLLPSSWMINHIYIYIWIVCMGMIWWKIAMEYIEYIYICIYISNSFDD